MCGSGVPSPSSAVTETSLWVQLAGGVVGIDLATNTVTRVLRVSGGSLQGLQYDRTHARLTYGMLVNATCARVASYQDAVPGVPALSVSGSCVPLPASPGLSALLSDQGAIAVITSSAALIKANLSGEVLSQAQLPALPTSMAYEPFVF